MPTVNARPRLGELLTAAGSVTSAQLEHALGEQVLRKLPIGRVLIDLNFLTDERLHEALARQCGVPYVDLESSAVDRALTRLVGRRYAGRHALVPVSLRAGRLTVAMDDPTARGVVDELARITGCPVDVVTAPAAAIQRAARRLYESDAAPVEMVTGQPEGELGPSPGARALVVSGDGAAGAGRADLLVGRVLGRAVADRASDVHVEMLASGLAVRFRVDGVLRPPPLGTLQDALDRHAREVVSRVKVLAALDIAERRRPQDGSFQVRVDRAGTLSAIDCRVSVLPSHSGESVVIRLLDRSGAPRGLADLALSPIVAARLDALLGRTTGIVLVTGPTGSGKSTTLYACLMHLHRPELRILTAEDPVEYLYPGLSQCAVDPAIGNTFAGYLRAFLRHDPEVIMVGEIRDEDTAEMAFRAAQTGHLLLSTLHTNTAVAALPRLVDLHVDASLIAASLTGVLSQRLARRICSSCREPAAPSAREAMELFGRTAVEGLFYRGAGCAACGFTGYRGRLLLTDFWVPDDDDLMLVTRRAPFDEVVRSAARTTIDMAADAHARLRAGETTAAELVRVLPYAAISALRARYGRPETEETHGDVLDGLDRRSALQER
ncbi:MAG TPA: ATPase, T2SS/T4P/T4SS family [Vicinamibacterales bacterium]|nr:ATPase, T2SS/T4P/T4SS family [Vicinamibacterales bacterium]